MSDKSKLSALLQSGSLNAKYQDDGIIVYSLKGGDIHKGLLFNDTKSLLAGVKPYVQYLRSNPYLSIIDWVAETGSSVDTVENRADPRSLYYVERAANYKRLLTVAAKMERRAKACEKLEEIDVPSVPLDKHRKLKNLLENQRNSLTTD